MVDISKLKFGFVSYLIDAIWTKLGYDISILFVSHKYDCLHAYLAYFLNSSEPAFILSDRATDKDAQDRP